MKPLPKKLVARARTASNRVRSRTTGADIHPTAWVMRSAWIEKGAVIGPYSFVNRRVEIDAGTTVGQHVAIAPGVRIVTASHELGPARQRAGRGTTTPVTIGDGCWLGVGSTILPGVDVAPGCVVAAGAVVAKSTEPNGLYAGIPARRIRDLD